MTRGVHRVREAKNGWTSKVRLCSQCVTCTFVVYLRNVYTVLPYVSLVPTTVPERLLPLGRGGVLLDPFPPGPVPYHSPTRTNSGTLLRSQRGGFSPRVLLRPPRPPESRRSRKNKTKQKSLSQRETTGLQSETMSCHHVSMYRVNVGV